MKKEDETSSSFFVEPIQFPFHGIVLDIIGDMVHFDLVANDMIMIT